MIYMDTLSQPNPDQQPLVLPAVEQREDLGSFSDRLAQEAAVQNQPVRGVFNQTNVKTTNEANGNNIYEPGSAETLRIAVGGFRRPVLRHLPHDHQDVDLIPGVGVAPSIGIEEVWLRLALALLRCSSVSLPHRGLRLAPGRGSAAPGKQEIRQGIPVPPGASFASRLAR